MSCNTDVPPGSYRRDTAHWVCMECGRREPERMMKLVSGRDGWFTFQEPDWACLACVCRAYEDGATWTEWCAGCWHVMEHDPRAGFHPVGETCPLVRP